MRTSLAVIPLACILSITPTPSIIVSMTGLTTIKDADARRYKRVPSAHARAEWLAKKLKEERAWSDKIAKEATKKINDERKWADRVRLKADRDREALRAELEATRKQLTNNAIVLPPVERSVPQSPLIDMAMIRIPDVRLFPEIAPQPPVSPQTASLIQPGINDLSPPLPPAKLPPGFRLFNRTLAEATDYLIATATPGGTMRSQGTRWTIEQIHPQMRLRLAEGVYRMRRAGYRHFGIFSGYRRTGLDVGGFNNKDCSGHSYGAATDMRIAGGAGSKEARRWSEVVRDVGLYLPYGYRNRAEYNHTQLVSRKTFCHLAGTITKKGPKDQKRMWLALGVQLEPHGPFVVTSRAVERTKIKKPIVAKRD